MKFAFALLTFVSTFSGGLVGLKYRDKLHSILGFTAGVLLGVVSFDLFPEMMNLVRKTGIDPHKPMIALVAGFLIFHVFEKLILIHHAHEATYGEHRHPSVGVFSAMALSAHSFLDGVGIGIGFQISSSVGVVVAVAVIAHDFSDGLNTASLMLLHQNPVPRTLTLVLLDAVAPLAGTLSTLFFKLPENTLVLYLGFFAGFLLCIGASDILPEAHSKSSSFVPIVMTLLGVLFVYLVTRII